METTVFLVVLGAVVLLVLYLMLHREATPRPELIAPAVVVETPVVIPPAPPPVLPAPVEPPVAQSVPSAAEPATVEVAKKPRRRKTPVVAESKVASTTGVAGALAMLKQGDGLATAFILKEIFDPPVSRRRW